MSQMPLQTLITGANRGIGLEFVRQLSAQGWRVFACCRDPQQAEALNALVGVSAGKVSVHRLAVDDANQIQALAQQLQSQPIDLLINNAGVYAGGANERFGSTSSAEWLRVLQINTIAPVKMAEAFVGNVAQSSSKP